MLDKYGIHRVALQDTFYKTTSRSRTRGSGRGKGRFGGGRGGSAPVAVWPLLSTIESDAVYIVWHVGRGGARGARARDMVCKSALQQLALSPLLFARIEAEARVRR